MNSADAKINNIINCYLEALFTKKFEYDKEGAPYFQKEVDYHTELETDYIETGLSHYPFLGYSFFRSGDKLKVRIYV